LKPEAFRAELQCRISNRLPPEITAGTLLNYENDLIKLTALSTVLAHKGISAPSEGFGRPHLGDKLHTELNKYLLPSKITLESSEFSNDTARISAFANNEQNPGLRWDKLSRILDGKRVLHILCSVFQREYEIEGLKYINEVRGCLANRIASKRELLDEELCTAIERFSK
jgi:hypothetical protein